MIRHWALLVLAAGFLTTAGAVAQPYRLGITYSQIPSTMTAALHPKYPNNCVLFLRNDVGIRPWPNKDLTTWTAKKGLINVTSGPRYGDLAIIEVPSGQYSVNGHIAMVRDVTINSIEILEADFGGPHVQMRRATGATLKDAEKMLRIIGYYRP